MNRSELLARLRSPERYDLLVIGGGATGLGIALDAAVRYLAQGKLALVREALNERSTLLANAPHLVTPLPFVMSSRRFCEQPWYGLGLKVCDALAADYVVNATGVRADTVRDVDVATAGAPPPAGMVAPSQGVHLVVDASFLGSDHALLVPKTADGRVPLTVPWLGRTVLGTTDTPRDDLVTEPQPFAEEVDFILREARPNLKRAPQLGDVRSIWVGLRPFVKPDSDAGATERLPLAGAPEGGGRVAISPAHRTLPARASHPGFSLEASTVHP